MAVHMQPTDKLSPLSGSRTLALAAKRLVDIVVSSFLLVILSPLLALFALFVKLDTDGAVLYHWKVVGRGERFFTSYKFRTMVVNADALKEELQGRNEMQGPVFKIKDDPRITRTGKWLRKYSLDELPQLWSVLKGDMSLVGPRPPLQTEFARFNDWQRQKVQVKPGLTCLWQVSGRNEVKSFDDWVRLDLEYIQNWSLLLDVKILFRTIPVVLLGKGR
jgi:lipopolysaccharide/colanic/teichoic acid biosynthesis glycosyltransferase